MVKRLPKVRCPQCGTESVWSTENKWRPFCSERCKLIDLGEWATEKYKVPVAEQDDFDDLEQPG